MRRRYSPAVADVVGGLLQPEHCARLSAGAALHRLQRLREDVITEKDQRQDLQTLAPNSQDGLYLVPKVLE